jgi:hypothetical protein
MLQELLRLSIKVALASLVLGALMTHFGITTDVLIARAGLTPEQVQEMIQKGITWALPNMLLGSLVIVPLWLLALLFMPPRRSGE